jgi:tetratricopeptide (TPR) repeat protein
MSPYILREEIQMLRDKWQGQPFPYLYPALSELLFTVGKIPAAMNLMEHSLAVEANAFGSEGPGESSVPGPEEGHGWFRRGLEYADACLYEEASACLNLAVTAGYDTFETHYCLAGVHKSLGKLEEAESHCRKSLEYNPAFSLAFILLGPCGAGNRSAQGFQRFRMAGPGSRPGGLASPARIPSSAGNPSPQKRLTGRATAGKAPASCYIPAAFLHPAYNSLRHLPLA